jgi:hypothetical protein
LAHDVAILSSGALEFDNVAWPNVLKTPEEAVTMSRYSKIAWSTDSGRARYPPDSAIQREIVRIIENGHLKADLRNAENSQRSIGFLK